MKEITLTKGMSTIVDDESFDKFGHLKWHTSTGGYAVRRNRIKGTNKRETKYLHREIMNCPDGMVVDHINGNALDNRKCNLRICTNKENFFNSTKPSNYNGNDCSSNYKGVSITKRNRYESKITHNDNDYFIGNFSKEEDAALAYNRKAKELFGEFAWLNRIEDDGRELKTVLEEKKTSKYKGVSKIKDSHKFSAQIHIGRKKYHLGRFSTEKEAAIAYNEFILKHQLKRELNIV